MRQPRALFHMSPCRHPVGRILRGNGRPKVSRLIEAALEEHRPRCVLARRHAVFATLNGDFRFFGLKGGCVFEVSPWKAHTVHDAAWVGKLQFAQ